MAAAVTGAAGTLLYFFHLHFGDICSFDKRAIVTARSTWYGCQEALRRKIAPRPYCAPSWKGCVVNGQVTRGTALLPPSFSSPCELCVGCCYQRTRVCDWNGATEVGGPFRAHGTDRTLVWMEIQADFVHRDEKDPALDIPPSIVVHLDYVCCPPKRIPQRQVI